MSTKSLSVIGAATYEVTGYIENPVEHYQQAQAYMYMLAQRMHCLAFNAQAEVKIPAWVLHGKTMLA